MSENTTSTTKKVFKSRQERKAEAKTKGEKFLPQYNGNAPKRAKFDNK